MFERMRYAAVFGVLGAFSAWAASRSAGSGGGPLAWGLAAAEGTAALCLFTMAACYGLDRAGTSPGRVSRVSAVSRSNDLLTLPYRVPALLMLVLYRRFDSMEMMHPVGERLYVGRIPFPSEGPRLSEAGVTSVLNLCAEFPRPSRPRGASPLETGFVPILDGVAPSERQFRAAVDWIAARHAEGHSVLVHCAYGRGRSVTVAAAALCRLGLASGPDDALARIAAVRPKVKPTRSQRLALARFLDPTR